MCPKCKEFGTLEKKTPETTKDVGLKGTRKASAVNRPAQRLSRIDPRTVSHEPIGISELDRVLGGGLVPGGAILMAGEPGVGKSTLLLAAADKIASSGKTVLYASGEETENQIKLRAIRTGANSEELYVTAENDLSVVLGHIESLEPDFVIVDSIQTLASPDIDSRAGGVAQTVEVASALSRTAKEKGFPIVLVGQATKNNELAGPRTVEHLVDTVLWFEGDKNTTLRLLRSVKNRFGPADEVGCFAQTETGIEEVTDPSGLFLGRRDTPIPGTCVTVVIEGRRALLAEIQALVTPTSLPVPRRQSTGLDNSRAGMVQAVVQQHAKLPLHNKDVFVATVGGMKIVEPVADLALVLSIISAVEERPIASHVVALGEVSLSGEIRNVSEIRRRVTEAGRLGFTAALVPPGTSELLNLDRGVRHNGVSIIEVGHVVDAVRAVGSMKTD